MHRKGFQEARALIERALRGYQEIGSPFNVILVKSTLAHLERQLGNYDTALTLYRETILSFRDTGQTGAVAHQLECFGFIALARDQKESALQLFAAANSLREKGRTPMTPDEQVYFDEQVRILREKISDDEFRKGWENGRLMTMEQAIHYALELSIYV